MKCGIDNECAYDGKDLDNVDQKGEARITWQPEEGLRFATVVIKDDNGYIVAARSLNETENLIGKLGTLVFMAWFAFMVFSIGALGVIYFFTKKVLL